MARGFESKSVQSQWQDAEAKADAKKNRKRTSEEVEHDKQRESLELSRRRIENELETTKSQARYTQLEAALAHLDQELAKLG